jgi:isopropylmalate/homocitrate/citramalate synthase
MLKQMRQIPITLRKSLTTLPLIPILFDVSLRDGLQGLPKEEQDKITIKEKVDIYHNILFNYKPTNIEIGSIVNGNVLPIMKDSLKLWDYAEDCNEVSNHKINHYLLVPSIKKFHIGYDYGIKHFSFITSVSDSFQQKNINKNIVDTKKELREIFEILDNKENKGFFNTKLYISCIDECPIQGKINVDFIIHEILNYHKELNINEFCLSDTCGSLQFEDFKYIVDTCLYFGMIPSQLSLHLHIKKDNIDEIKQIVFYALDRKIMKFDVSILESGGCSVTMPSSKLVPNMSYDLFLELYKKYIDMRY